MKQTRYITTTIQPGNRLEIDLPNLPIGQTIEVIFLKLVFKKLGLIEINF